MFKYKYRMLLLSVYECKQMQNSIRCDWTLVYTTLLGLREEFMKIVRKQWIHECKSFDIQRFELISTNSKCKIQNSSNQVTRSCPPSCDLRIKCISLEQSMDVLNPRLQHSTSIGIDTKLVFRFWRVIFDHRWPTDAPTTKIPIGTYI